jgi:hypothetical protein
MKMLNKLKDLYTRIFDPKSWEMKFIMKLQIEMNMDTFENGHTFCCLCASKMGDNPPRFPANSLELRASGCFPICPTHHLSQKERRDIQVDRYKKAMTMSIWKELNKIGF